MTNHFLSVCVFCFLCATHSPCESHSKLGNTNTTTNQKADFQYADRNVPPEMKSDQNLKTELLSAPHSLNSNLSEQNFLSNTNKHLNKSNSELNLVDPNSVNDSDKNYEDKYLKKIFSKYGDGTSMTMDGFEKLLNQLDLMAQVLHNKIDPVLSYKNLAALISHETENLTDSNITCLNRDELVSNAVILNNGNNSTLSNSKIDSKSLQRVCPALLYTMIAGECMHKEAKHSHLVESTLKSSDLYVSVWLYSIIAVAIISFCGILSVLIIPMMQNKYYQPLLQFLIALAVGTLAGDALLHLLPHAMSTPHSHSHEENGSSSCDHDEEHHDDNMWKGFTAMLGLILFFFVEKVIIIVAKWRKEKQMKEKIPKMKVMKEGGQPSTTSDKQCKHKYSSIPYCYDAIAMIDKKHTKEEYPVFRLLGSQDNSQLHNETNTTVLDLDSTSELNNKTETNQNMTECPNDLNMSNCTEVNKMLASENEKEDSNNVEYTVILREHENKHHGHSHAHGHVHAAPRDMSSVAWMVIMGDGLHNFTDGMAIGAAFSSSIAGGCSTAVAVFCHELPHELGDFAMLLKAGMSIKQALFYNLLSSILCILGNAFGVWLGNTEYASSWVFAVAAGTFLYIALVDMIPELSNGHEQDGTISQCVLQLSGLILGFAIMALIAKYEHNLKSMFHEP